MKSAISSVLLLLLPVLSHAETFISVESANELAFYPQNSAPAKVVALNASVLPAEIGAKLTQMDVHVGEYVNKGQVLAKLDCNNAQYQLQIEQAKTEQVNNQLSFDESEFVRGQRLSKQKNIGESDFDRRKTQLGNSKANLKAQQSVQALAELNVQRCLVIAPFSGVITARIASVGSMVDFGKPVIEMVDTNTLEVSAKVSVADLTSLKNASQYQLSALSQNYALTLLHVIPFIEAQSRSQEVRFNVNEISKSADEKSTVIAGSTGRVIWTSPLPFLPAHLLQNRNGVNGYFTVENNLAKFVEVKDAQEGRPIPFSANNDDLVIVDGRFGLNDGDIVNIVYKTDSHNDGNTNTKESGE